MKPADYFKIGYVSKTHGLKGEVTVVTELASSDWQGLENVFIEINGSYIPHFIQHLSVRGDKAFVKFDDVDTLDQADSLKGRSLYLAKTLRPALKRGEFYDDEVIGFEVESDGEILGPVREVVHSGSNRLLVVACRGREIYIPTNGPFIKGINKSKKQIRVELPDGFLDI